MWGIATIFNLTELEETNKLTYRCSKCDFVYTTIETIEPGSLNPVSENENKEDLKQLYQLVSMERISRLWILRNGNRCTYVMSLTYAYEDLKT